MLRLRLVIPIVVVFVLTALAAVLPSITFAADGPAAATIHDGGDPTTWGFTPASTTVAAGQTVTWTNSGAFAHDAAATDKSWKTPLLNTGASASVTFSTPGTFTYVCTPHPWMLGTIVVTAAAAPAPPPPTDPIVAVAPPVVPVADVAPPITVPDPIVADPIMDAPVDDSAPPIDSGSGT